MKVENVNINFRAGLTRSMMQEIGRTDIRQVSAELSKKGIDTDFKQNSVVCWASKKCVEFIEELNQRFGLKLGLPNGIFVEDFKNLDIVRQNSAGMCNFAPVELYRNKSEIVPGKTIFFNSFGNCDFWQNINKISDENYQLGVSTTNFFLETFLHEFAHVIHADNLIKTLGGKKYVKVIMDSIQEYNLDTYRTKYQQILQTMCRYAKDNPMEAISCDLSSRMIAGIDKNSLKPTDNFMKNSPYEKIYFWDYLFNFDKKDKMFSRFWRGNFD